MSDNAPSFTADVAFLRFSKLIARGYRPKIVLSASGSLHSVEFEHPSCTTKRYVPKLALWSDGVLATNGLLWPALHVPSQRIAPPQWQKCILAEDAKSFDGFVESVALPSFVDVRLRPIWKHAQGWAFRMMFGSSLCMALALPARMVASASGLMR